MKFTYAILSFASLMHVRASETDGDKACGDTCGSSSECDSGCCIFPSDLSFEGAMPQRRLPGHDEGDGQDGQCTESKWCECTGEGTGGSFEEFIECMSQCPPFDCKKAKPINKLVMRYVGQDNARVRAYNSKNCEDGTLLAEMDVANGVRFGVSSDDLDKDISYCFYDDYGRLYAKSTFHLSCSDEMLDGPEDCFLLQGDGKQKKKKGKLRRLSDGGDDEEAVLADRRGGGGDNVPIKNEWKLVHMEGDGKDEVTLRLTCPPPFTYDEVSCGSDCSESPDDGENCFQLTPNGGQSKKGYVWFEPKLDLTRPFTLNVNLLLGVKDLSGADGIAFAMQNQSFTALGDAGGGLGIQGVIRSVGVVYDTFPNSDDEVAVFQEIGSGLEKFSSANLGNVEDGNFHNSVISWDPNTESGTVTFDGNLELEFGPVDFANILGSEIAWWGFTAGTGSLTNRQVVCINAFQN